MVEKEVVVVTMKRFWRVALPLGLALCTLFIWSQSLKSAAASTVASDAVRDELSWMWTYEQPVKVNGEYLSFSYVVRKMAHLAEFLVLGLLWGGCTRAYDRRLLWLVGLPTGVIDEGLQFLAPGRAPLVTDVLIDTAGFLCGVAVILLITHLWKKKKK